MKATGIVRKVDTLGRVVIPMEIRRSFNICDGDAVEMFTEGDMLILRKYNVAGDVEQMLDNLKRSMELMDPVVPGHKMMRLMEKVDEMKAIMKENQK